MEIFVSRTEGITGNWRAFHDEAFHDLYELAS